MDPLSLSITSSECCASCHLVLKDPHIQCNECQAKIKICLECFARGREFGMHESFHPYKIVKNHVSVLEPDWSAEEEELFLNSLIQRGHGNWQDIAKVMFNKSPSQCERHFEKVYVEDEKNYFNTSWKNNKNSSLVLRRDQPLNFVCPSDQPPRPSSKMSLYKDLAGYNASRGDFEFELENGAELDIQAIQFDSIRDAVEERIKNPDDFDAIVPEPEAAEMESEAGLDKLESHLQVAALDVYGNKIKSRNRIKKIVRELGLLNKSKVISKANLYQHLNAAGPGYARILTLGRLFCSFDFDYILESLQHDIQLRGQILHLQEFRLNGLTKFLSTAFYTKLKRQRERDLKQISSETVIDWVGRGNCVNFVQDKVTGALVPTMNKKASVPLDIVGTRGYEKLTVEERTLCSETRVYPEMFLEIKESLISECRRLGGLRLADARPVVKIDVNKTKKLYDFLLRQGVVHKFST